MEQTWQQANEWERQWHGDCANTHNEETKQYIYARYMVLDEYLTDFYGRKGWDFGDKTILDCGSGPCSILLKSKAAYRFCIDPCNFPDWVLWRYAECGIVFINEQAENSRAFTEGRVFDEILLYNCLQHTDNPEKIISNLLATSKIIRVFEWIDTGVSDGHLHNLTQEKMDAWLGAEGKVAYINEYPVVGRAYYGIFKGEHYGV